MFVLLIFHFHSHLIFIYAPNCVTNAPHTQQLARFPHSSYAFVVVVVISSTDVFCLGSNPFICIFCLAHMCCCWVWVRVAFTFSCLLWWNTTFLVYFNNNNKERKKTTNDASQVKCFICHLYYYCCLCVVYV